MESRKTFNTNIVDDFLSVPTDIYTPSSDQWFKSDDHYNSGGVLLKIHFWTDQTTWTIRTLSSLPMENWQNLEYKDYRALHNLSNEG
jgi:hypothetical protein